MRRKVGDLAVIVRALVPANVGRLVTIIGPSSEPEAWDTEMVGSVGLATNLLSGRVRPQRYAFAYDRNLRPIRPDEGTDEMIRIAGLPREVAHG